MADQHHPPPPAAPTEPAPPGAELLDPPAPDLDRAGWYSVAQAAAVLGVSDTRVRQMADLGRLEFEAMPRGRRRELRFPTAAVHAMAEQRARERAAPKRAPTRRRRPRPADTPAGLDTTTGLLELELSRAHARELAERLVESERLRGELAARVEDLARELRLAVGALAAQARERAGEYQARLETIPGPE